MVEFLSNLDPTAVISAIGFVLSECIGVSKAESSGIANLIFNIFKRS